MSLNRSIKSAFSHLAVWATLFGLGWALLAAGLKWGLLLISLSVLYLAWALFTSKPITENVPGMLRLVFFIMALAIVLGINRPNIISYFRPAQQEPPKQANQGPPSSPTSPSGEHTQQPIKTNNW